jgi:hypothetical protein
MSAAEYGEAQELKPMIRSRSRRPSEMENVTAEGSKGGNLGRLNLK